MACFATDAFADLELFSAKFRRDVVAVAVKTDLCLVGWFRELKIFRNLLGLRVQEDVICSSV